MSSLGRETSLALLLGLLAGGVTALLLAPDSGRETRRKIRTGARDLEETAGTKTRELADAAHAGVDHIADAARSQVGAVRGAVAEGREAYRQGIAAQESNGGGRPDPT